LHLGITETCFGDSAFGIIDDFGTTAEIDLGGLARIEFKHGGSLRMVSFQGMQIATNAGIASRKVIFADQALVDSNARDIFFPP